MRGVDVLPGEAFRVGPPRAVGKLPERIFSIDAIRDGTKLLAAVPAGKQPKPTIRVVLDWTTMLAER